MNHRCRSPCGKDVGTVPCISNGTPHHFAIEAVVNYDHNSITKSKVIGSISAFTTPVDDFSTYVIFHFVLEFSSLIAWLVHRECL